MRHAEVLGSGAFWQNELSGAVGFFEKRHRNRQLRAVSLDACFVASSLRRAGFSRLFVVRYVHALLTLGFVTGYRRAGITIDLINAHLTDVKRHCPYVPSAQAQKQNQPPARPISSNPVSSSAARSRMCEYGASVPIGASTDCRPHAHHAYCQR
jgi:hypothetical protein